ncbi:hypothetical protein TRIP_D300118 [uncultured Paludibacter sp.]|uniref:Uncharacterized protein n=1 Tax=uncultured Paludibacter sp. TaxID=497635 RepID=A0A653AB51_9BACT|nr:hypothetical protein TRIP_D300118 [uncultured Paludibacter sp.]
MKEFKLRIEYQRGTQNDNKHVEIFRGVKTIERARKIIANRTNINRAVYRAEYYHNPLCIVGTPNKRNGEIRY